MLFRIFIFILNLAFASTLSAGTENVGEDTLYGVKSTASDTQDWGTINPTDGSFTSIKELSPKSLGWPLGDIGSEPDPINGYVYTRQTNSGTADIMAIKKSDGTTKWLGLTNNDLVIGYDTQKNKMIFRRDDGSINKLMSYENSDGSIATISSGFASDNNSWQAGGIGSVDSYGRTAFQIKANSTTKSTLYKINLDTGEESKVIISDQVITIAWDSKNGKLFCLYDSDGSGGYRIAVIDTDTGALTNISDNGSDVSGISNYVQMIAPNDQRYYVQTSEGIEVVSLTDGSSLGTFTAPLRLMPVGDVVLGSDAVEEVEVDFDINDPDSGIIKKGINTVNYSGSNASNGGVEVEAGTLKVAGSDNLGTGEVSLEGGELEISTSTTITNAISSSDDDSAIDTGSNSVTVSGAMSGSNEINKSGTGTLTLTGTLNNTGGIDITAGTLVANGTGVTPVTVTSGTLEGSGTIGSLTSNSFVAPGNSIGTLNVAGNVTLNSGSILIIEVNANGTSDKIIATGSASLGGTLRISPEAGTYTADAEYTFITASNVTGKFSTVVLLSCASGDSVSTTYGDKSVTVTLSGCRITATNGNTIKSYINDLSAGASSDLSTVITALNSLTGTAYDTAINQLDHDTTAAIASVGQQQLSQINAIIGQRIETVSALNGLSLDNPNEMKLDSGWGQAYGASGAKKPDSNLGINGYRYNFSGITIGSDFSAVNDTYGTATSIIMGDVKNDGSEGKTKYTSLVFSGFKSQDLQSGKKIHTTLSLLTNFNKSERYIKFGAINRTASASYKSYALDIGLDYVGTPLAITGGDLKTILSSGLTFNYQEGFTETGADSLNLKVNNKTSGLFRVGINQTYLAQNNTKFDGLSPFLTWGLNGSHYLNSPTSVQGLQGQNTFTIRSDKRNNVYGKVGLGVIRKVSNNEKFSLSLTQKFLGGFTETSTMLQYKKLF